MISVFIDSIKQTTTTNKSIFRINFFSTFTVITKLRLLLFHLFNKKNIKRTSYKMLNKITKYISYR